MKTSTLLRNRRGRALFGALGLGSLAWLLVRSVPKPQRLSYPCQQAALAQSVGALGYLASFFGLAHLVHLLRRRVRLGFWGLLGLGLALALATVGGQIQVAPLSAATGPLPTWTSPTAVSDVFVVDQVPVPECSLDGGVLPASAPCNEPSYALRDRGVDRLIERMDVHGTYFYKTAAQPNGIFGPTDVVVIKVNNQWAGQGTGDGAGRLVPSSDTLKGLIWRILQHPDTFTGEVVVADNTQGIRPDWNVTPGNAQDQNQSYQDVIDAFQALGYPVSVMSWDHLNNHTIHGGAVGAAGYPAGEFARGNNDDAYILLNDPAAAGADQLSYPKFTTAGGSRVSMRYGVWNGASYDSSRLTFINMPVLKRHGMAGSTICWKNLVGFQSTADPDRRFGSRSAMHEFFWASTGGAAPNYGLLGREMALVRAPKLNLVDAIWVGTETNSRGNAVRENVIAASTDPFAADWYTSEYVMRNAVTTDGGSMQGVSAARGGTFRRATRVNQKAAKAAWPSGQYHYVDFVAYDGTSAPSEVDKAQMNVYVTAVDTPAISITNARVSEGASGSTPVDLTVTVSPAPTAQIVIPYSTVDGTAVAGADYEAAQGELTFEAGETTHTLTVAVLDDTTDEAEENFFVNLTAPGGTTLEGGRGTITILDDDPAPFLTVADTSVTEGNSGSTSAVFTLSLSQASGRSIRVGYATANGTAQASLDYTAASGTLTFAPGETSTAVSVPVRGDTLDEDDETFLLNVTAAASEPVTISGGQGQATILDDDGVPALSLADVSVTEGSSGTRSAVFTALLSRASGREVTVDWQTAEGTASAGSDFTPGSGTLTFPAGTLTRSFSVPVLGDTVDEPNEAFTVRLTNPVSAEIARDQATATIVDDDPAPSLTISDLALPEGHAGTSEAALAVHLSAPSARQVTVNWTAANGTAKAPDDYASASGTLTFVPGEQTQTIAVAVVGDTLVEPDEAFRVNLGGAVNATLAKAAGIVTIRNDDSTLQLTASTWSVREGASATITVSRAGALGQAVTVEYAAANGTATSPDDYAPTSGTLTFAPGAVTCTFMVPTVVDPLGEPDETVLVSLLNPSAGATLGSRAGGALTILDDDPRVRLASSAYQVVEGGTALIRVVRSGPTTAGLTVGYRTVPVPGGASTDDYTPVTGTLTFAAGQTAAAFSVPTTNDTLDEADEIVGIELTGASLGGAPVSVIPPAAATLTIIDNDTGGVLQFGAARYSLREGGGSAHVIVTRSGGLASGVTVSYATQDGTAAVGQDYEWTYGTLSFGAGQTSAAFDVPIIQDGLGEGDETFTVQLSSARGRAVLGLRDSVPVTIVDDDAYVRLVAASGSVVEGGDATLTFQRVNSTAAGVSVDYRIVAVTADGADVTAAPSGSLTFGAGQLTRTLTVPTVQDAAVEGPETFRVDITGASIGVGAPSSATVTITDNDRYAAGDIVFVTEGSSFAPVLTLKPGATATVLWTFHDGATSSERAPTKDYGSDGRRVNRLRVTPWSALRRINIGYDAGDGGTTDIEMVADQHVREVYGLSLVAPYLEQWASSYNDLTSLSFDNFVVLDTIECYDSWTLRQVSLRNTPRLRRACFEDCDLQALDLTQSPALEDLRGAVNAYPTILFRSRHPATWHVCVRDNPQITNRALFSDMGRFPEISELFIWNTHQSGALNVHSTSATRYVNIAASGNGYTSADFTGALRGSEYGLIDLSSNQLVHLTVAGCSQLRNLNVSNNPLDSAEIDAILAELDALGTSGGAADLTGTAPPSAAGLAHHDSLEARHWTVDVDVAP